MNREQTIRDTAYAIWEAEGRPTGRSQQHWFQAEKQVGESTKAPAKKKVAAPKAKKTEPAAAAPEPAAAAPKKTARTKKA